MKTNKLFGLAVLACGFAMSFTSCTNDDNPVGGLEKKTISFENQTLNEKGFWCGEVNDNTQETAWGTTNYLCSYKEDIVTFNTTYGVSSWFGYAISNRTETGFEYGDYSFSPDGMSDQFNSVTGKAKSGKNFCVVQTYGETIQLVKPAWVNGFYFTNSSYAAYAYEEGDGMSPGKFEKDDWFKCIVTGKKQDGSTKTVDIYLAKDGEYVKDWQYCDLSSMGKVVELSFAFDGSKKNDWGVTTPAYICIDDIEIEY